MRNALMLMIASLALCSFTLPAQDIQKSELSPVPYIHPTTYFVADEDNYHCQSQNLVTVRDTKNRPLAKVCKRFLNALIMEGTGVLSDRGEGRVTLNWAGNNRFRILKRCTYGEGASASSEGATNCLLPFHTLATDLRKGGYKVGDVLYIPKADGIILPDGSVHNGIFEVRDTGGAFKGTKKLRIDMFVGLQKDDANVFAQAGFRTSAPFDDYEAFLVTGESKLAAKQFLKEKFPDLY